MSLAVAVVEEDVSPIVAATGNVIDSAFIRYEAV